MAVTVLLPGVLRGDAGDQSRLVLDVHGSLAEVMAEVTARWPRLARRICDEQGVLRPFVNVYVDGEDVRRISGFTTPVPDGAEIQIIPSVAG
ncbi:MAG TPA: MoaD/ThiS family protein, partial [Micromonosporaceae bacterium]